MTKIQDAIGKVQQKRRQEGGPVARRRAALEYDADSATPLGETMEPAASSAETVDWDYQGTLLRFDRQQLISAGLLDPDFQRKHLTAEYRELKKNLRAIAAGADTSLSANIVFVTSAKPAEGKSFISLNLAMSLALDTDVSVVLVDLDSEKSRISELLGASAKSGLTDALGDATLEFRQVISATDVPRLSVLPAGACRDRARELLSGGRAKDLFGELAAADPRRFFIVDLPSVQSPTAASALALQLGQILLVVKAGVTPRQSVVDALEQLGPDRPVGILLNQVVD